MVAYQSRKENKVKKKEGEVEGEDEEGADGSVFFAAKWQRARANRVETSAAISQEYKRTTDSQATGHLLTTSQSVSTEFLRSCVLFFSSTTYHFTTTRLNSLPLCSPLFLPLRCLFCFSLFAFSKASSLGSRVPTVCLFPARSSRLFSFHRCCVPTRC